MSGRYAGFGSDQGSNDDFVTIGTHFDPSEPTNSTSILATFGSNFFFCQDSETFEIFTSVFLCFSLNKRKGRKASKLVDLSSSNYGYDGKRFHGAFTGGFNAGFYNTVGSVEGFQNERKNSFSVSNFLFQNWFQDGNRLSSNRLEVHVLTNEHTNPKILWTKGLVNRRKSKRK